jgi:V/A-type H+-transporting ATPase subunit D
MRSLPPGRMGRLWLRRRLDVASRGIGVLEQKTHALAREERRLRQHVEDTREDWEDASQQADRWGVRAAVMGGSQQFELARSRLAGPADARVSWRSVMGVACPAQVRLSTPDTSVVGSLGRSSALGFAATAHRRALEAALAHAAATRALELVEAELAVTRRRLRGLENGWVPRLEVALHDIELDLAEDEREDMVRARWVADRDQEAGR